MIVILLEDLFTFDFIELDFEEFLGCIQLELLPLSLTRHVQRSSRDKITTVGWLQWPFCFII